MVGGVVGDLRWLNDRVWINCLGTRAEEGQECAIYVERVPALEECTGCCGGIKPGDMLWWQGGLAYWTPQPPQPGNIELPLRRIGFSGVRPPEDENHAARE